MGSIINQSYKYILAKKLSFVDLTNYHVFDYDKKNLKQNFRFFYDISFQNLLNGLFNQEFLHIISIRIFKAHEIQT